MSDSVRGPMFPRQRDTVPVGRITWSPWRGPAISESATHAKGWECPKCSRVWAPSVTECKPCNSGKAKRSVVTK